MNPYFEVFWQKLPSVIFEPIAACGLVGALLAAVLCHKARRDLYLFLAISLSFMLTWRIAARIEASRYGLILVVPAIIATSFLAFELPKLFAMIPRFPPVLLKWLPAVGIGILVLLSILRLCLRDSTMAYSTVGRIVAADVRTMKQEKRLAKPIGLFAAPGGRLRQLQYYSHVVPVITHPAWSAKMSTEVRCAGILQIARQFCHCKKPPRDSIYFFIQEKSDTPEITAKMLNLPEESWCLVAWKFRNESRHGVLRAYRYIPPRGTLGKPLTLPIKR